MNIWDSVQRGLEKATQEATRIARTQRLRANVDKLTQQIHTQEDNLLVRAMEVFAAGHLTQSELLPICQELMHLQQQMEQTQQELKQVQMQGIQQVQPASGTGVGTTVPMQPPAGTYAAGSELPPTVYAPPPPPPDYKPYASTMPAPPPPPPPGVEPVTISSFNTIKVDPPESKKQLCQHCHSELIPGDAYCHNCGTVVENSTVAYQATVRSSTEESEQETVRGSSHEETPPASIAEQPTIREDISSAETKETNERDSIAHTNEKDGGD
jgi:hypothetical protein